MTPQRLPPSVESFMNAFAQRHREPCFADLLEWSVRYGALAKACDEKAAGYPAGYPDSDFFIRMAASARITARNLRAEYDDHKRNGTKCVCEFHGVWGRGKPPK